MDNILINFTADPAGLQPGIDGLLQLETIDKELGAQVRKTAADMAKQDKALSDSAKAGKKDVEGLTAAFTNLGKSAVGGTYNKSLETLQKNLKGTKDEFKQLSLVMDVAKKKMAELKPNSAEWKQLNDQVKAGEQVLRVFGEQEEQTAVKTKSLRLELRQLKEEIAARTLAGETGPELDALIQKAGQFDDTLKDVNQQISRTGSDTRNIEGFVQLMGTGVQAIAGLQAAQALLGDENEDFNEALAKMNALLVISNSVQGIQTALQKESAAILLIENVQRKLSVISIQLETAAQGKGTIVRYAAAAAQRVLNAVMAANPIGIVLVALSALASLILVFTSNTKAAAVAQAGLNDALKEGGEFLDAEVSGIERANKRIIADMKVRGASDKELTDQEISNLKIVNEARERSLQKLRDTYNKTKVVDEETAKSREELGNKIVKIENEIQDAQVDAVVKRSEQISQANKESAEKAKAEHEKRLAKQKEFAQKEAKAAADIAKLSIEDQAKAEQNIIDTSTNTDARLAALTNVSRLKAQILEQEKVFELKNTELTGKERELITATYLSKLNDLERETSNERADIIKEGADRATEAEEKGLKDRQDAIDAAASVIQGDFDYSDRKYQLEVMRNQAILLDDKSTIEQRKTAQGDMNKFFGLQMENQRTYLERMHESGKLSTSDYYSGLAELDIQYWNQKIQLIQQSTDLENELRQKAYDIGNQIVSGFFEIDQQRNQQDLQNVQDLYDKKLITEREYNKRKKAIEQEQANDQKKKAVFDIGVDLARSIFQIQAQANILAANPLTSPLAAKALAQIPFLIGESIVASAFILARKYKTGKINIEGPGTKTSDSIPAWISKGESVINADSTLKHKLALEAINNNRFKEYLDKHEAPKFYNNFSLPTISAAEEKRINSSNSQIDYDKLGEVVAQKLAGELANHSALNLNIDSDGFNLSVQKGLETINYKNRKLNL